MRKPWDKIAELYYQGCLDYHIDTILKIPRGTAKKWRVTHGLPKNPKIKPNPHQYACYGKDNDELITLGTAKECAYDLGYKSVENFYRTFNRFKNTGKGKYHIFLLDNAEEDITRDV